MNIRKLAFCLILVFSCIITTEIAYADRIDEETLQAEARDNEDAQHRSKDAIGNMLLQAVSLMGIPYKWGGNTPETGMDCSGFIRYVFKKSLGINLPRTAAQMAKVGKRVPLDKLEPGDLVFFNTFRGSNMHVGMYIGSNQFIVAPKTGQDIQIMPFKGYWRSKANGAKRIVQEDEDDNGNTIIEDYHELHNEALPVHYTRHSKKRYSRRHKVHGAHNKIRPKLGPTHPINRHKLIPRNRTKVHKVVVRRSNN